MAIESLYISKKELVCVIEYLEGGTLLDELKNVPSSTSRMLSEQTAKSSKLSEILLKA